METVLRDGALDQLQVDSPRLLLTCCIYLETQLSVVSGHASFGERGASP
jgi:hypothetical protein